MYDYLWGIKTQSLMDIWTLEHFFSGISIGYFLSVVNQKIAAAELARSRLIYFDLLILLGLAYFWEAIEHYLEAGVAGGAVQYWFQGVEHWSNRLISDPLMLVLGYFVSRKYAGLVPFARGFTFFWLFIHIIVFPHSMYLHDISLTGIKYPFDQVF